jgi:2-amino-4-hydroxy-6-hydroxymethyldihydropteridine diphosphokinase
VAEAWLAFGANIGTGEGEKRAAIARALSALERAGVRVLARSSDWRTPPWGPVPQDWYVNACATVETSLPPLDLLRLCLDIERSMGRVRLERWGPRLIDIDLLAYEGVTMETPDLVLPHPRMLERAFVLVPLAEIAPDLVIAGTTVVDAAAAVPHEGIERIT